MKIIEFIEKNQDPAMPKGLGELLIRETSIWTNGACLGYIIMALEEAGYDCKQIAEITGYVKEAMEFETVENAEKHYNRSVY